MKLQKLKFFRRAKLSSRFWAKKAFEFEEEPFILGWKSVENKMTRLFREKFREFKKNFDFSLIDLVFGRFAVKPEGEKQTRDTKQSIERFINTRFTLDDSGIRYNQRDVEKVAKLMKEMYLVGKKNAKRRLRESVERFVAARKSNVEKAIFTGEEFAGAVFIEDDIAAWLDQMGAQLITNVSSTQRRRIAELISVKMSDGTGVPGVYKAVRTEFSNWSTYRARMISRTETAFAINSARTREYESQGVTSVEWICGPSPCPICDPNCGKTGNAREGAGFESAGLPPLHPNCVCDVSPVVEKTEYESLAENFGFSEEEISEAL